MNQIEEKKNNIFFRIMKSCYKLIKAHSEWLIKEALFVIIMLVIVVPAINRNDQSKYQNARDVETFIQQIRVLSYYDENTYILCGQFHNKKITKEEFMQGLLIVNRDRTQAYIGLLAQGRMLQRNHQLSNKTYSAITEFGKWHNDLDKLGLDVCSGNLKNPEELKKWTDSIIHTI